MNIKIIGRYGSTYKKKLAELTEIGLLPRRGMCDLLVNYGLAGSKFRQWMERNPMRSRVLMINRPVEWNKFSVIGKADSVGVKCPESRQSLMRSEHNLEDWLEKPYYSCGGRGIQIATGYHHYSKYFQKFVKDRRYELRVHAFRWIPQEEWCVMKRVGEADAITWNYRTGGRFITVKEPDRWRVFREAKENSVKVMETLGMGFGAVDFIVDEDLKVWFIEINSSPGFCNVSEATYVGAFNRLKEMELEEVRDYAV